MKRREITVERNGKQIAIRDRDIIATLDRGTTFRGKLWTFCIATALSVPILFLAAPVISYFVDGLDEDTIKLFAVCGAVIVVFLAIMIPLLVGISITRSKVRLWMSDAVLLRAGTKTIGKNSVPGGRWFHRLATVISVSFNHLGKKHKQKSIGKDFKGAFTNFEAFADKELYILYSPSYDKVLFLDLKKGEKIREELGED